MKYMRWRHILPMVGAWLCVGVEPVVSQSLDEAINARVACYELGWVDGPPSGEMRGLEGSIWLTGAPFAEPEVLGIGPWQMYVVRPAPGEVASPYGIVGWRVHEDTLIVVWHAGPGVGVTLTAAERRPGFYEGTVSTSTDQIGAPRQERRISLTEVSCQDPGIKGGGGL